MGKRRAAWLVLLENVTGFLTSHGGKDFRVAMLELNRLGYGVDPFIIDALHFVPQSRPRLFVVGELGMENRDRKATAGRGLSTKRRKMRRSLKARFDHAHSPISSLQIQTSTGDCVNYPRCLSAPDV